MFATSLHVAAVDQLYEELRARTWAVHALSGAPMPTPDHIEQRAALIVDRLTAGTLDVAELTRLLFPFTMPTPQDPWWETPLGRLLDHGAGSRPPQVSAVASIA